MSRLAIVDLEFGGEERQFRLGVGELARLQEKTGVGPYELHLRLLHGSWRCDDIRETIRLGLIGGGAPPEDAARLVRDHVDERPRMEPLPIAQVVLGVALYGVEDEQPGKSQGAEGAAAAAD